MKKSIFLFFYFSVFASCAVSNPLIQEDNTYNKLKSFKLIQTPRAYLSDEMGKTGESDLKVHSTYVYEPKVNTRPHITVTFKDLPAEFNSPDYELFMNFDGEIIKVSSNDQMMKSRFAIPENLWVSFVYAQKINCRIQSLYGRIEIELNELEKNMLTEFFQRAIQQRDIQFPEIPDGKKKW